MIEDNCQNKITVGWREWVSLPDIGLPLIKAKVDTGARTSALHAFEVSPFEKDNIQYVRFFIHPIQENDEIVQECIAPVCDYRWISDSGGHREQRFVIETPIQIGGLSWPIEITLTNRDTMKFRMLLGRTAMENRIVVDPVASYLHGKVSKKKSKEQYKVLE